MGSDGFVFSFSIQIGGTRKLGYQYLKKGAALPGDSLTREFNRDKLNVEEAKRVTDDTDVISWFRVDVEMEATEEVVGLGGYGRTLTIITADVPDDDVEDNDQEWQPRFT